MLATRVYESRRLRDLDGEGRSERSLFWIAATEIRDSLIRKKAKTTATINKQKNEMPAVRHNEHYFTELMGCIRNLAMINAFFGFIAVATLLFVTGEKAIHHLFSRDTPYELGYAYVPFCAPRLTGAIKDKDG